MWSKSVISAEGVAYYQTYKLNLLLACPNVQTYVLFQNVITLLWHRNVDLILLGWVVR